MIDRPFWSDNFDMDLPKVIPGAREIVGDLADVVLWTTGHTTDGVLNHPNVWNDAAGMVAFFGFAAPCKPAGYVSSGHAVRCSVWEAVRDAWPHSFVMLVEHQPVWDTYSLRRDFDAIMWAVRGWPGASGTEADAARARVRLSLERAVIRLRDLLPHHAGRIRRLEPAAAPAPPPLIVADRHQPTPQEKYS